VIINKRIGASEEEQAQQKECLVVAADVRKKNSHVQKQLYCMNGDQSGWDNDNLFCRIQTGSTEETEVTRCYQQGGRPGESLRKGED
jgi:hypothetical protein